LSDHKLILGDCLDELPKIFDKNIDLVLTDPPYGTTQCKWDSVIPFEPMWNQLKRVIKDNGCIALFGSEPFSSALRMSNIKQFKYDWVWNKVRPVGVHVCKYRPMSKNENISIFGKGKITFYPQMIDRKKLRKGSKEYGRTNIIGGKAKIIRYTSVGNTSGFDKNIKVDYNYKGKIHPTQKPVKLYEWLLINYAKKGDKILDTHLGSGSIAIACHNLGYDLTGYEIDKDYYNSAIKRIEQHKSQIRIF